MIVPQYSGDLVWLSVTVCNSVEKPMIHIPEIGTYGLGRKHAYIIFDIFDKGECSLVQFKPGTPFHFSLKRWFISIKTSPVTTKSRGTFSCVFLKHGQDMRGPLSNMQYFACYNKLEICYSRTSHKSFNGTGYARAISSSKGKRFRLEVWHSLVNLIFYLSGREENPWWILIMHRKPQVARFKIVQVK